MYVEPFHRLLKRIYTKGRVNKRLDKCIHVLLKLARDKDFDRSEGKKSEYDNYAHNISHLHLSYAHVNETTKPEVTSNETQRNYTVTQVHTICPHKCIHCCSVCVHMFVCNCVDALIRTTMFKHIHLVARYKTEKKLLLTQVRSQVYKKINIGH